MFKLGKLDHEFSVGAEKYAKEMSDRRRSLTDEMGELILFVILPSDELFLIYLTIKKWPLGQTEYSTLEILVSMVL